MLSDMPTITSTDNKSRLKLGNARDNSPPSYIIVTRIIVIVIQSVAYLECAKGGGPGSLGVGSRGKAPVWGLGDEVPRS